MRNEYRNHVQHTRITGINYIMCRTVHYWDVSNSAQSSSLRGRVGSLDGGLLGTLRVPCASPSRVSPQRASYSYTVMIGSPSQGKIYNSITSIILSTQANSLEQLPGQSQTIHSLSICLRDRKSERSEREARGGGVGFANEASKRLQTSLEKSGLIRLLLLLSPCC